MLEDNQILNEINDNLKFIKNQLSRLLSESFETSEPLNRSDSPKQDKLSSNADFQKLAAVLNVGNERINEIIDIDGREVRLIRVIDGTKESVKLLKAALGIMAATYYLFNLDTLPGKVLVKLMENQGIDTHNLSRVLKQNLELFIAKGKGTALNYKINLRGINQGTQILKELLNQNS